MKVCQLCAVDFTLKKFLLPLIDGMHELGWEVTAVCSDGKEIAGLRVEGYHIDTLPIARSLNPWFALRSLFALTLYFHRHQFDVLHVHTPVAAFIGRIAAKLVGIPLVIYTAHGFYFHDDMQKWRRTFFVTLERIGGHFTDLLFCQSAEDAKDAISENIAHSSRVIHIGNGVDVVRFDPANVGDGHITRTALGIPKEAFVIGLIGRQVREKGVAEFLQAVTALASRFPNLWVLSVGDRLASDHSQGVETNYINAYRLLGDRIIVLGQRDDIPQLLAAMDLFCLPSWREGMPRTIIEAMMMAKPVLATDIRGSREEVMPEETGVLVPPRSPEQLAVAMRRFLEAPAWARSLGMAGRQRALRLYDEKRVVALQLEKIIEYAQRSRYLN